MTWSNKSEKKKPIEQYDHKGKDRVNNPPVGLVTPETDKDSGKKLYAYDPHIDPSLQWAGKAEHTSFEIPTVSLHVHERIDPRTIIEAVRKRNSRHGKQLSLFAMACENPPLREAIEFYKHKHNWSNRLIAGDSLLVMNSLLEKEGLAGQVQMIYIDPPYGIKYGSNFQPFVNKRDVKDGRDEDLTAEPEMIKAFRDTWELGIHSYLPYLRDRLLLARELLSESGSIFVQISDENVHLVRCLMDEVFGVGNFITNITFQKTGSLPQKYLSNVCDYLIVYGKDKNQTKWRDIFIDRLNTPDLPKGYDFIDDDTIEEGYRRIVPDEHNFGFYKAYFNKIFQSVSLESAGTTESGSQSINLQGKLYIPRTGAHWKTSINGIEVLNKKGRILFQGNAIRYKMYLKDFPVVPQTNIWSDLMGASDLIYVVQTNQKVISRCLLMSTDPGDLVLDITCGSGTTAYVAEQWGRRWITCDTSRVAITLAKQRLMTALFDYYQLAYPNEGVGSGFKYKTVPHITLKSIANNEPPGQETLYDQPYIDNSKARVTGPFTVEAVPAPVVKSLDALLPSPSGRGAGGEGRGAGKKPLDRELLEFARQLRREQTDTESLLWSLLRDRRLAGSKFRRQHPVEPYIIDFYCHESLLAVELDGGQHNEPDERARDSKRTAFLEKQGIRVLRFWNNEVLTNTEAVLQAIYDALTQTLSQGERALEVDSQGERALEVDSQGERALEADESISRSGETLRQAEWREELLKCGIRAKNGQYILFSRIEPLPGTRWLHAEAETKPNDLGADSVKEKQAVYGQAQRVVISFGPEHAPLEQRQVELAIEEAQRLVPKPKIIIFASFQFDPEAARDIDETDWPGVSLLKVQMNADLLTDDLKKKRTSNESFWLIGQPDVVVEKIKEGKDKGQYRVAVQGFDYYNTRTGVVESGGTGKIALWMLDTDYDGRSLFPRQVFFPMAGEKDGWSRLAKNLKAEIDEELIEVYRGTVSLPFFRGDNKRIAVKIVDDRGIESLKIMEIKI